MSEPLAGHDFTLEQIARGDTERCTGTFRPVSLSRLRCDKCGAWKPVAGLNLMAILRELGREDEKKA